MKSPDRFHWIPNLCSHAFRISEIHMVLIYSFLNGACKHRTCSELWLTITMYFMNSAHVLELFGCCFRSKQTSRASIVKYGIWQLSCLVLLNLGLPYLCEQPHFHIRSKFRRRIWQLHNMQWIQWESYKTDIKNTRSCWMLRRAAEICWRMQ